MKRIIWHWTAGTHTVSKVDRKHYHFIIAGDGTVVHGDLPPEANLSTKDGDYAAHTLNANTGAIGIAVAAMAGARERPFGAGRFPITTQQVNALARLTADLCQRYRIPVTRETVLSHAEVQPTLGIPQRGKWDITWLPGMAGPEDAIKTGDWLRSMTKALMPAERPTIATAPTTKAPKSATPRLSLGKTVAAILAALGAAVALAWVSAKAWLCALPIITLICGG